MLNANFIRDIIYQNYLVILLIHYYLHLKVLNLKDEQYFKATIIIYCVIHIIALNSTVI